MLQGLLSAYRSGTLHRAGGLMMMQLGPTDLTSTVPRATRTRLEDSQGPEYRQYSTRRCRENLGMNDWLNPGPLGA